MVEVITRQWYHQPESRVREIRQHGSEGGAAMSRPYPYRAVREPVKGARS